MPGSEFKKDLFTNATTLNIKQSLPGVTVVIAPHPDDESLGCGGTIALLKNEGKEVHLIFVSDGSMSHPLSKKYNTDKLILLREAEALSAAKILGIPAIHCSFMRLQDGAVPTFGEIGFKDAVIKMTVLLKKIKPKTIFLPWKNDPHSDHQASWQIANSSIKKACTGTQLLHYLIWFWERGVLDYQLKDGVKWCKIDVSSVINLKRSAIAAHISQVSRLIDDDATGFILSPEVLAHFEGPFELFAILKN